MKLLWKQLLQPHIDYCSQLYFQGQTQDLQKLENLQKVYTKKIREVNEMNYWERLKFLGLKSQERRIERYRIIYTWKCLEGKVPDCGVRSHQNERNGRFCDIVKLNTKSRQAIQTLKEKSFKINGPKLFNCLPKSIRDTKDCSVDEFKFKLDNFLKKIPDQPKTNTQDPEAMDQFTAKPSNSLLDQVRRMKNYSGG